MLQFIRVTSLVNCYSFDDCSLGMANELVEFVELEFVFRGTLF